MPTIDLSNGIYLMTITMDNKSSSHKIIKYEE